MRERPVRLRTIQEVGKSAKGGNIVSEEREVLTKEGGGRGEGRRRVKRR